MNKQQLKKTTVEGDFIFHEEWLEIFQNFSVEQAGQVIKALVDYAKDGTLPADSEIAAICTFLLANVDHDRSRIVEAHRPMPRRKATPHKKYVKIPYRPNDKASLLIAPKLRAGSTINVNRRAVNRRVIFFGLRGSDGAPS